MNNININGYEFEGPYDFVNTNFNEVPGVYAIVHNTTLVYVGITHNLKERMSGHEKENCWRRNITTTNSLFFLKEPNEYKRRQIEISINQSISSKCNEQI